METIVTLFLNSRKYNYLLYLQICKYIVYIFTHVYLSLKILEITPPTPLLLLLLLSYHYYCYYYYIFLQPDCVESWELPLARSRVP